METVAGEGGENFRWDLLLASFSQHRAEFFFNFCDKV
jgi:hypothetical protein